MLENCQTTELLISSYYAKTTDFVNFPVPEQEAHPKFW